MISTMKKEFMSSGREYAIDSGRNPVSTSEKICYGLPKGFNFRKNMQSTLEEI